MYAYVSATVLQNAIEAQYEVIDISTTPINLIFSLYSEIYLTLSNPYITGNVFVDFLSQESGLAGYTGTIPQWLAAIGNKTLPTIPELPSNTIAYARYSDATKSGYKMDVCKIGFQLPVNYPIDMLPDLKMSRPKFNTNLSLIYSNCLVTVNGFLHQASTDGTYAYIVQGANTMRKSNLNHVGILSFLDIGAVTTIPVDTTAIYSDKTDPTQKLKNKIYMYLNQDLTGKTVLLSLGGYLVFPDPNIFYQVGNNTFALHTEALPIPERYFESSQYIDLSSLGLDSTPLLPGTINVTQLLSDEVLTKYLQLSQSFWIIVDTSTLKYEPLYLEHSKLPGMFISYKKPINPLFVGYGRMAEYWTTYEDGQWSVTIDQSFLLNYTMQYEQYLTQGNINPACVPNHRYSFSRGYTMQIHN